MAFASTAHQKLRLVRRIAGVKNGPHQLRLRREGVVGKGVVNLGRLHPVGALRNNLGERLLIAIVCVAELGRRRCYRLVKIAVEDTRLSAVDVDAPILEAAQTVERPKQMLRELPVGHCPPSRAGLVALRLGFGALFDELVDNILKPLAVFADRDLLRFSGHVPETANRLDHVRSFLDRQIGPFQAWAVAILVEDVLKARSLFRIVGLELLDIAISPFGIELIRRPSTGAAVRENVAGNVDNVDVARLRKLLVGREDLRLQLLETAHLRLCLKGERNHLVADELALLRGDGSNAIH